MERKAVSGIMLILQLIGMLTLAFNIQSVKASGTIYIKADGSIDPPTAKIQRVGDVYTFTANIYDSIVVQRSNIVVDGNGYTLSSPEYGDGFVLVSVNNVTIQNTTVKNFNYGVYISSASKNTISGNNITSNAYQAIGITIRYSWGNTVSGNNITNITKDGISLESSYSNIISGNTIKNTGNGVYLNPSTSTRDNTVSGNTITNIRTGVYLDSSSNNNIVSGNTITNTNAYGVRLFSSSNNNVYRNNMTSTNTGISLYSSSKNTISGNNITNAFYGLGLDSSSNNAVSKNNIIGATFTGVALSFRSSNNILRDNRMISNKYNFWVSGSSLSDFVNDVDASNTVDGKPIYYWVNVQDTAVPLDGGYVALVNCRGITVQSLNLSKNGQGILLAFTTSSTITTNNITNNYFGVELYESSNNGIYENNITDTTTRGILAQFSHNNIISGTNITNTGYGFWLYSSSNNTLFGNNVTNSADDGVRLWVSSNNNTVSENTINIANYGISLRSSSRHNTVSGNTITNTWHPGVDVDSSSNNTISGNTITNTNMEGIRLYSSSNNTISGNTITYTNGNAILLWTSCSANTISGNTITNTRCGISLSSSCNNNTVSGNTIETVTEWGVGLYSSSGNIVIGNTIANTGRGVELYSSSNNKFYHNNFIDNTQQVVIINPGYANFWDNGYPSGGNHWSDYTGTDIYSGQFQNEAGSDRIGDTPYFINAENQDNYPFVSKDGWGPVTQITVSAGGKKYDLTVESNAAVTHVVATQNTLHFTVTGPSGQTAFVNVVVPVGLNKTQIKVFVNEVKLTPPPFPIITSNGTHYFIYFEMTLSNHAITIQYAIPDIAVINVTPSKTVVGQGYTTIINVTAQNKGHYTETFNVTVYASREITLLDNFDDNTLDPAMWTILSGGGASSISETNQRIEIITDGSNRVYLKTSQPSYSTPSTIKVDTAFTLGPLPGSQIALRWDGEIIGGYDWINNGVWVSLLQGDNRIIIETYIAGNLVALRQTYYPFQTGVWYHVKITDDGETIMVYIDNALVLQAAEIFWGGNYVGLTSRFFPNLVFFDNFMMQTTEAPTAIQTQTITLANGNTTSLSFNWNTTGFAKGNYTISAYACPVPGETDTTDNTLTDGWVVITIPGDVDGDFRVSYKDLFALAASYGSKPGDPNWNPACDIDGDNRVSYKDLFILAANYGKK